MRRRIAAGLFPAALLLLSRATAWAAAEADTVAMKHDPLKYQIVVTGVRVPESVLRAPAAISVVERSGFEDTRVMNLGDALARVPGVFAQGRSGGPDQRISIRGYGARGAGERSNSGVMRGIRVLTDGIPVTEPDGRTSYDLIDLEGADRVEVSRSNVSALYGNASGGVIQLRTNLDFDHPWAEYRQRLGSYGFHRERGAVGFTAGALRGAFDLGNMTFDGWREHSAASAVSAHLRGATRVDDRTKLGFLVDGVSDITRYAGPLTQEQFDRDPQQANARFVARDERRRNQVGRMALSLDRSLEAQQDLSLNVFVEPKKLQRSERGRYRDFTRYHLGGSGWYQLRKRPAAGLESRFSVGADEALQDGSVLFYNLTPDGGRGTDLVANQREGANSAGGFVQEELIWDERWSVRVALRYDNLWYISEDHQAPELDATRHFTHVTPKGSVSYQAGDATLYAALGGGVEAPAFNEIDPPAPYDTLTSLNPFLEPMLSTTYELGAKGQAALPGAFGRLRYDAALYWIDVENDIVPYDGGAYYFTAGRTRRKGIELGLDWLPIEPLQVSATTTFSNNEYLDYENNLGSFDGNQQAGLPRFLFNARARYTTPWELAAEVSLASVGAYWADDANTAKADAYTLLGASLGWSHRTGAGTFRAFVAGENLTDQHYVGSVFINGTNGEYYEAGLPRNWSAGLSLRWR
jgi:iron complex outermembrane receptor protein